METDGPVKASGCHNQKERGKCEALQASSQLETAPKVECTLCSPFKWTHPQRLPKQHPEKQNAAQIKVIVIFQLQQTTGIRNPGRRKQKPAWELCPLGILLSPWWHPRDEVAGEGESGSVGRKHDTQGWDWKISYPQEKLWSKQTGIRCCKGGQREGQNGIWRGSPNSGTQSRRQKEEHKVFAWQTSQKAGGGFIRRKSSGRETLIVVAGTSEASPAW